MKDEILEEVWTAKQKVSSEYRGDIKAFIEGIKAEARLIKNRLNHNTKLSNGNSTCTITTLKDESQESYSNLTSV